MPKPYDYEAYFSHGMKPTDEEISGATEPK